VDRLSYTSVVHNCLSCYAVTDDVGKRDAQTQLDGLLEEMSKRKNGLEELERRAVAAALVEERMRYCVLVGCLKPIAVSTTSTLCLIHR